MLKLSEHFEYYHRDHLSVLQQYKSWESLYTEDKRHYSIYFDKSRNNGTCVAVALSKDASGYHCSISSSYYIGLDRIAELNLPVYVAPKINKEDRQLNYMQMLLDALKEPENFDHLEGLITTKFEENWIEVDADMELLLTPFLLAQFLVAVKSLVKRGLKKSYYQRQENLNNKIKGKVLVGQQIKQNSLKNRATYTVCQFQEFGFDTEMNRFLKWVLSVIPERWDDFSTKHEIRNNLDELWRFCQAGFQQVSQQSFTQFKYKENNPFYKNYNLAISLGNQILALKDFNVSKTVHPEKRLHPPFWIDMSKLFELYVFKHLRQRFPARGAVAYHQKFNRQEPDFILNTESIQAVVDAKYKPRYASGNPSKEDAWQLAGYCRLQRIYGELGLDLKQVIPAYFVYPSNMPMQDTIEHDGDDEALFETSDTTDFRILEAGFRSSGVYNRMYMQEILLPTVPVG